MKDMKLENRFSDPKVKKVVEKTVWVISTARNAILVLVCGLIATLVNARQHKEVFSQTGEYTYNINDLHLELP
jgi:hypothetical protein